MAQKIHRESNINKKESLFEIDYIELYNRAESLSEEYKSALPFQNCFIDNFFKLSTYKNISNSFPHLDSDIWKTPVNIHMSNRSVTKQSHLRLKEYLLNENQRRLFMELNSSLFITFLEKLTGIVGLIPDPYLAEGGYVVSHNDSFLDIHADFSHHDHLMLERRLNILIYLNDEWEDEYGGALNLYDKKLNLVKSIYPIANRVAIFTTTDESFHGFPDSIKCPKDMVRKSINLYYYTVPTRDRIKRKGFFPNDPTFIHIPTKE
jgi:Rps23 Pro-64 3,4-dihydroxylase Tpa1-like proline 4-hydroxylase